MALTEERRAKIRMRAVDTIALEVGGPEDRRARDVIALDDEVGRLHAELAAKDAELADMRRQLAAFLLGPGECLVRGAEQDPGLGVSGKPIVTPRGYIRFLPFDDSTGARIACGPYIVPRCAVVATGKEPGK